MDQKQLERFKDRAVGFRQGIAAARRGVRLKQCPIKSRDQFRKGWLRGWKYEARKIVQVELEIPSMFVKSLRSIYR